MNLSLPMQNLSAPNTKALGTGADVDALTALGQQLEITPEMLEGNPELAKLLGENAEGLDFETLLNQSEKEGKLGKVSDLLKGIKEAAGELGEEVDVAESGKTKSLFVDPKAEVSKKAQTPVEHKSIFDLSSKKSQAVNEKAQPKLQSLSEFVANQSPSKKIAMKNAYKSSMKESMFNKKVQAQVPSLEGAGSSDNLKVTDLMLQADNESGAMDFGHKNQSSTNQLNQTQAKVFDINQLATNKTEVIGQIQDYIIQSKASSEPTVQMSFEHKDLGQIDLQVTKLDNNQMNIMINSRTQEGAKFFTQNQGELMQSLSQAGIQVADLKLDSSSQSNTSQNNSNEGSMAGHDQKGQGQARDQRESDSKRREELWKLFEGQEAA